MNRAQFAALYRKWQKRPEDIISLEDTEELQAIKRAHALAFAKHIGPWKKALKIGPIIVAVVAFVLFYSRGA